MRSTLEPRRQRVGRAFVMRSSCVRLAFVMRSSCVRPAFVMRYSCVRHAFVVRSSCVRHAFVMRSSRVRHAFVMRSSCVRHAFVMRSSCVRHVFVMRSSCVRHAFVMRSPRVRYIEQGVGAPAHDEEPVHESNPTSRVDDAGWRSARLPAWNAASRAPLLTFTVAYGEIQAIGSWVRQIEASVGKSRQVDDDGKS